MDIKAKVTAVTTDLHTAALNAPKMGDVDNLDDVSAPIENPDGSAMCSFQMTQMVSEGPIPGARGPGRMGRPLGELQYHVTVIARWVPYDDE